MKLRLIIILLIVLTFNACKTRTVYIPLENVKTEYRDHYLRDSVHVYDSVFVKQMSDTVFFEKYRYLYRDKIITDTIIKSDSIQVPYSLVETKEVNRLTSFQSFQIWCGRILLVLILCYLGIRYFKR